MMVFVQGDRALPIDLASLDADAAVMWLRLVADALDVRAKRGLDTRSR